MITGHKISNSITHYKFFIFVLQNAGIPKFLKTFY